MRRRRGTRRILTYDYVDSNEQTINKENEEKKKGGEEATNVCLSG